MKVDVEISKWVAEQSIDYLQGWHDAQLLSSSVVRNSLFRYFFSTYQAKYRAVILRLELRICSKINHDELIKEQDARRHKQLILDVANTSSDRIMIQNLDGHIWGVAGKNYKRRAIDNPYQTFILSPIIFSDWASGT